MADERGKSGGTGGGKGPESVPTQGAPRSTAKGASPTPSKLGAAKGIPGPTVKGGSVAPSEPGAVKGAPPIAARPPAGPVSSAPPPEAPFAVAGDDEWESELAAWDAAIPIVTPGAGSSPATAGSSVPDSDGAVPDDENAFFETPTTVVSQAELLDLDDLPEMIPAGAFDEGVAPASGSYAALVATDSSAPSMFESDPAAEESPSFPTDTLGEMSAAPWSEDIRQLIALGAGGRCAAPERAYLETLALVIEGERSLARDKDRTVALALGAARVAELLGDTQEASAHLDAALVADGSSPAVHRARLVQAERSGRIDDDAAAESLARLALMTHPDQTYYRSLKAEWILARAARGMVDGTAAAMITAAPEGLPRLLAEAELTWRQPTVAAAILETAAHLIGGGLGAALLVCAAGLNEIAGDVSSAAEQRFVAARLDDQRAPAAVGQIRDLARLEPGGLLPALEDLLARFPPSSLKVALARWGAFMARRTGEMAQAWRFVEDPARLIPIPDGGPPFAGAGAFSSVSTSDSMSAALARDRLDLVPVGQPGAAGGVDTTAAIDAMLGQVATTWSTPTARICLALRACELAGHAGGIAFALGAVEKTVAEVPDATLLAPAVEELAWRALDQATHVRGLRLWRGIDPARWTSASMDLAAALQTASEAPAPNVDETETTWSVLNEIAARDAASPIFWRLSALAARRGDFAEAAGHIERGIGRPVWRHGALATPLAELAAELTAREDLSGAATRLGALRGEGPLTLGARQTLGRVLRRLGDRDLWAAHVHAEIAVEAPPQSEADRQRRVALLLEPVFWPTEDGGGDAIAPLVSTTLDLVALHPTAFGLALAERPDAGTLIERLVAGARGPGGARWTLGAAMASAIRGDPAQALALAVDDERPSGDAAGDRAATGGLSSTRATVARRFAWAAADAHERRLILRSLADRAVGAAFIVEGGEAAEALGNQADAARLFERALATGGETNVAVDASAGLARLSRSDAAPGNIPSSAGKTEMKTAFPDRISPLKDAARAGRWNDVVAQLVDAPPNEEVAGLRILTLAAELDDGRAGGARSGDIWTRALVAPRGPAMSDIRGPIGDDRVREIRESSPDLALRGVWLRIGDRKDADPIQVGGAIEHLAAAAARAMDQRSAALLLVEAARLDAGTGDIAAPPLGRDVAVPVAVPIPLPAIPFEIEDTDTPIGGDESEMPVEIELSELPADAETPQGRLEPSVAERRLRAAVRHDSTSAPAAMAWRRWLLRSGRIGEAAQASAAEAEALLDPALRVRALLRAAAMLAPSVVIEAGEDNGAAGRGGGADWVVRAAGYLHRALEIAPSDHEVFMRLRELYEQAGRHVELADLLRARLSVTSNPFEVTALHLARAEIFAGPLGDHGRAKTELESILQKEPQHARALARLADIEQEDGHDGAAAELLIRRAFIERSPEKLRELFLRLGRIYSHRVPDPKRALGAYSRVLQLDANNREALDELSKLYLGLGETKNAIAITERLVKIETRPAPRAAYHIRLGHLAERAMDSRAAAQNFRRAVDDAPRDVEALGELARYLEKTRDTAGRRALLDHAAADLRAAVFANPLDVSLLNTLVAVLRWRGRTVSAAAAAELGALFASSRGDVGADGRLPAWAAPPSGGRRLAALAKASVDEQTFSASVPPSVRQLFRLLGPTLWEGAKSDLSRLGVDRADRLAPGRSPRDIFDTVAGELAAGPFDLYVVPARSEAGPAPLHVEPGKPPAIVLGASLLKLGPHAMRFAAGRTLRLVSTHLDMALAGGAPELGAWLGGVIRQFIGDYRHPDVSADVMAARAARAAKLLPKKLRQEVMPFAMESSGTIDLRTVHDGIRDGANRIGLCASGSLDAAVRVILAASGAGNAITPTAILRNAEAFALLTFALSDEYDDLVRSLE